MAALPLTAQVAVIGAGAMGAGIAQVAAQAGHPVLLYDNRPGAAAQAIGDIDQRLGRRVATGKLADSARQACLANLQACDTLAALADAHLVIEAIVEQLAVKRQVFGELEALCRADCLLVSNTSSLSITTLAAELKHPERFAGLHFFNPAPVMPLVEVVSGLATAPDVVASLYDSARAWGKQPVHTRSTPGFIVNRVARPFYAESLRLLQEGAADCATLDALLREAGGFAMGAFELTDLIGHDVNYAVTCSVFDAYYQDMRFQPSLIQKELVDAGRLGRKSGQGFYDYREGAQRPRVQALGSDAVVTHCVAEGLPALFDGLLTRLQDQGVAVTRRPGNGVLRCGDAVLALSDGRMASQRAHDQGVQNLVLLDLALDFATATRVGISWANNTAPTAVAQAVALLNRAGLTVSALGDSPGLCVLRTVAMLANEGADAALQGVASVADIDLALRAGVNYPRGPLAWADTLGLGTVVTVLENLQAAYGEERYRPSLLLRRHLAEGSRLHD
ncbi:3-hydroxyacyl-CoA dehydrogenase PaaH [Pseudomonas eucalypticola]|uniref:3-hydroxyacyl-CoA dehydrogenase PaaC n=1 Tax=Pseudomonas eucalypticola TaxID=2599595 RepID=A0A7D5HXM9_9PSED|nr:3-hydroxyacyl-CoA dehydrogenase PaaH [Pseudomonas eucalypticola]QKZ05051.1 3-hydroxyacyl-CoA dehydrogenase PaaC [Pseudomonas eucalypticola]